MHHELLGWARICIDTRFYALMMQVSYSMVFDNLRSITIGGNTKPQLLEALQSKGIPMNKYAEILFTDPLFTTSEDSRSLNIVEVSLDQLGLPHGGVTAEIFSNARELGLDLCPLELAPHFRLQYLDQAEGPYLTIASQKTKNDETYPNGFYLRRFEGTLWLRGYQAHSEYVWEPIVRKVC